MLWEVVNLVQVVFKINFISKVPKNDCGYGQTEKQQRFSFEFEWFGWLWFWQRFEFG